MSTKVNSKLSVRDVDLSGKRVFMRVDFNVPIRDGEVADDTRIQAALPTINLIKESGAKLILASHLGRPKGERKPEFSLAPAAVRLGELLGEEVAFVDDCIGPKVKEAVDNLQPGQILVLENVRFYKGETDNDPEFARQVDHSHITPVAQLAAEAQVGRLILIHLSAMRPETGEPELERALPIFPRTEVAFDRMEVEF